MKKLFQKIVYYFIIQCLLVLLAINLVKSVVNTGVNGDVESRGVKRSLLNSISEESTQETNEEEIKVKKSVRFAQEEDKEGNEIPVKSAPEKTEEPEDVKNVETKFFEELKKLNEEGNNIKKYEYLEKQIKKINYNINHLLKKDSKFKTLKEMWEEIKKKVENEFNDDEMKKIKNKLNELQKLRTKIDNENDIFLEGKIGKTIKNLKKAIKEIKKLNPNITDFLKNEKGFEMFKEMVKGKQEEIENELNNALNHENGGQENDKVLIKQKLNALNKLNANLQILDNNKLKNLLNLKRLCIIATDKEFKNLIQLEYVNIGIEFVEEKDESEMTQLEEENHIKVEIGKVLKELKIEKKHINFKGILPKNTLFHKKSNGYMKINDKENQIKIAQAV